MTVQELIDLLSKQNPAEEVLVCIEMEKYGIAGCYHIREQIIIYTEE